MRAHRLVDQPIVSPDTDPSIGDNIQGPSLIRVPDWIEQPLGRYYLYFADHKGGYIRLAYADDLTGPWRVYAPGTLQLADSCFPTAPPPIPPDAREQMEAAARAGGVDLSQLPHDPMLDMTTPHIASPDVHVNHETRRIVMYFHGLESFGVQVSRVALSEDGVHFRALPEVLGRPYLRAFHYDGYVYALTMPGQFYRSKDGLSGFEAGPRLFNKHIRHAAVLVQDDQLLVFWTRVGRVNQLRDPAIFTEGDRLYLLYAVAGESGIAIAELAN